MSAATATTASSFERKRAVVLFGSPHRQGHTGALTDCLLEALPEEIEITFFDAYRERPEPCMDCGFCKTNDGCALHDIDRWMEAFERADFLVIATPVYHNSFPAPLKALFDRFQRYFNARFARGIKPPITRPKRAVLLATCGSGQTEGFEQLEGTIRRAFTVLNAHLCGTLFVDRTDALPPREEAFLQARRLAGQLTGA